MIQILIFSDVMPTFDAAFSAQTHEDYDTHADEDYSHNQPHPERSNSIWIIWTCRAGAGGFFTCICTCAYCDSVDRLSTLAIDVGGSTTTRTRNGNICQIQLLYNQLKIAECIWIDRLESRQEDAQIVTQNL